jgi:Tfp pilus assembly protein PilF
MFQTPFEGRPPMTAQQLAALMQAAVGALKAGDAAAAESLFRQIVTENPRHADAWHMLAAIVIRGGRGSEAIEYALRAHQLDRRNAEYLNTLGIAYGEAQQPEEAVRCFKRSLKERPGRGDSHYNLGKAYAKLGDLKEAERCYLRARQLDPERAEVTNSLLGLYSHQGRYHDALPLLADARERRPGDEIAVLHSALAALAISGADVMLQQLMEYVRGQPGSIAVREELALRLLAQGRFAEGWRQYAYRRIRPHAARTTELRGRRVLLLQEQGLGDHLFFLRFAPRLSERAASVAFECPAKLAPLLEGNPVVDLLRASPDPRSGFDVTLPLGDLPEALEEWTTPPAFSIAAGRSSEWRERLAALGPPPYLGVTWRGGTKQGDNAEFGARELGALYKEIPIDSLAAALREWRGTVFVLQRLPLPGEIEMFSKALGRQAHDLSALNDNLEDMAAVLSLIDEYVGVSNTNMHIRAGLRKSARVLVPFPPEFRWMHAGERSPWFPGFSTYRQPPQRDWRAVLQSLSYDITR